MIERALRWTALAIAGLAFIDPAIDVAGRTRPRLSVVVQRGPSMALPAQTGGESRLAAGRRLAVTLADRLGRDFIVQEGADASADAMVVIGDRYPEEPIAETTRVSTISLAAPLAPNVRIVDVTAPPAVPTGTAVPITATVEASGLANSTTSVVVRTAGIEVGRTDHRWTAERETWRSTLTVTPVGTPPFTFEIDAEPLPQERSVADNRALASVDLAPALRVLVVEARPSWASAFVRRALEADPRFEVSGVSEPSPRAGGLMLPKP